MSIDEIVVRRANREDLSQIVEVAKQTFPQDFQFDGGFSDRECKHLFENALRDQNEDVYVAAKNTHVLGFAYYINKPPTNGTVILEMMGIRTNLQGQGIGTKLTAESADQIAHYLREHGISNIATIYLTVSSDNLVAQRAYKKAGYEKIVEAFGLVGEGGSEIIMIKRVGDAAYRQGIWTKPKP